MRHDFYEPKDCCGFFCGFFVLGNAGVGIFVGFFTILSRVLYCGALVFLDTYELRH